jgi:hypothetical protein
MIFPSFILSFFSFLSFFLSLFYSLFHFETGSYCVAQAILKLLILLPQLSECWAYRHVLPPLTIRLFSYKNWSLVILVTIEHVILDHWNLNELGHRNSRKLCNVASSYIDIPSQEACKWWVMDPGYLHLCLHYMISTCNFQITKAEKKSEYGAHTFFGISWFINGTHLSSPCSIRDWTQASCLLGKHSITWTTSYP